jgi:hypothetical protein
MKLGTLSGCTHVNILGRSLGIFFRQFFVSWVLLLQLLHHLSDVFNQHSALSSAFKTIPIEILLCQHILPHTGSLPTMCLCAFLVALHNALEYGESNLFFSFSNW